MDQTIERLAIAYFGLCEAVTAKPLDEDASEEELLEEVLFDSCSGWLPGKDCLAFLGLCKALYQLPSALLPSEECEHTNSVVLQHFTLLFLPLEGSKDLVAILQVKSARNKSLRSIEKEVRCHHTLFCLLEQWGVTRRGPGGTLEFFAGMDKVYQLRKQVRRMKGGDERQLTRIYEDLSSAKSTLYISKVREKLEIHYSTFLKDEGSFSICSAPRPCGKKSSTNMDEVCESIHASTRRLLGVTVVDVDGTTLASTSPIDPESRFSLWRWFSKYHTMQKQTSIVQSFLFLPPTTTSTSIAPDGFLEPPPLSQLSSLYVMDKSSQRTLPDGRLLWTPMIYFHHSSMARVAFYQCNDASIMIFFDESQDIDFHSIEKTITRCLPQVSPHAVTNDPPCVASARTLDLIDESFRSGATNVSVYNPNSNAWTHWNQSDA